MRSIAKTTTVYAMHNPTTKRRAGARIPLDHDPTRLRARRVELGLTQAQVAEKADISAGHMCELESGTRNPSAPLLLRLARALRCETQDLMPQQTSAATE